MSSHRQPQAVQVASATTIGAARPFATSGGLSGGVDILVALVDGRNRPGATLRGTSAGRIFPESDGAVKLPAVGFRRSGARMSGLADGHPGHFRGLIALSRD